MLSNIRGDMVSSITPACRFERANIARITLQIAGASGDTGSMRAPLAASGLCLLATLLASCRTAPPASPDAKSFPWKIPSRESFLAKVPPPPAPDSAEAKQDLATVLELQAKATPARIARAKSDYDLTVFTFAPVVGVEFTPQTHPQTAKFFHELNDLVNYVNNYVKDFYKRPHPFEVSNKVQRIVIAPPGYSYPSYHSARCVVFTGVLDRLDPGHNAGFARIAREVEEDRVFAGEHFPSDIREGIKLGKLIWAALEKDENFRAAVVELKKAEWDSPAAKPQ
jgi:acid phosphatase (class A)